MAAVESRMCRSAPTVRRAAELTAESRLEALSTVRMLADRAIGGLERGSSVGRAAGRPIGE